MSPARRVLCLIGAVTITITAILIAPSAHADPAADEHFLAMLENAGMSWEDRQIILNNGHTVCANLWSGTQTFDDQVRGLRSVETGIDEAGARTFVAIAIQAFCPDITARRKVAS